MTATVTKPLRSIAGGVVAGAAGTLAMDLLWYSRYRRGGGEDGFLAWEFAGSSDGFDDAGPPAEVGRRVVKTVLDKDLPADAADATGNVVHWATGSQWGALYGLVTGAHRSPAAGLVLGPVVWTTAYTLLGLAGIYKPIWEYNRRTLGRDLGAHLIYGVTTATALRLLTRPS